MKRLLAIVAALAALSGCATFQHSPRKDGATLYGAAQEIVASTGAIIARAVPRGRYGATYGATGGSEVGSFPNAAPLNGSERILADQNAATVNILPSQIAQYLGIPNGLNFPLSVANGGTGTATPSLVAGSNVTITGTWPNQTVSSSAASGTVTDGAGTTTANELLLSSTTAHAYTNATTLPASAMPAVSGDVTIAAGTTSAIVSKVNGASVPASASLTGTNSSSQFTPITVGSGLSLSAGTLTATAGGGTVSSGTANQLGYYGANGSMISGLNLSNGLTISGGALGITETATDKTASYTLAPTDCGTQVAFNSASAVTVSVPPATGSFAGCQFDIDNFGAGTATISAVGTGAPTSPGVTTSTTGGTLAASTYYYEVTTTNGNGESAPTSQVSVTTTGTTSSDTVTFTLPAGATGGRVYRSTTSGNFANSTYYAFSGASTASYVDTGAAGTTGTPPAADGTASTIDGQTSVAAAQYRQCGLNAGATGAKWHPVGCTAQITSSGTQAQAIGFANGGQAQGVTNYDAPGIVAGTVQAGVVQPFAGTLKNLYIRTSALPASGQTFTYTLYVGMPGSMTFTTVTCQITSTSSNNLCSDTTDTASITAGQAWAIQVVTSGISGASGNTMFGLELDH